MSFCYTKLNPCCYFPISSLKIIPQEMGKKATLMFKYIVHEDSVPINNNNVIQEDTYKWALNNWSQCSRPCAGGTVLHFTGSLNSHYINYIWIISYCQPAMPDHVAKHTTWPEIDVLFSQLISIIRTVQNGSIRIWGYPFIDMFVFAKNLKRHLNESVLMLTSACSPSRCISRDTHILQ